MLSTFRNFAGDMDYTLNCNGRLMDLRTPRVMGIVNATPDSFYADSRTETERQIAARTRQILGEGADIIDVGACSTRPDSSPASEADETARLRRALAVVRREAPEAVVSVDTFRPDVARMAVEEFGVSIVNDVGQTASAEAATAKGRQDMFRMVARLQVAYVYMSSQRNMHDILLDCAEAADRLRSLGQKDILVDPGFGFGKTLDENYAVMRQLERMALLRLPVLVGVSRKSMVYRLSGTTPDEALNGTTVLNTLALTKGARVLRVHDVREAVEAVRIVAAVKSEIENRK